MSSSSHEESRAGAKSRFFAMTLDVVFLSMLFWCWMNLSKNTSPYYFMAQGLTGASLLVPVIVLVYWASEIFWKASPGKILMGLKIADETQNPLKIRLALLRYGISMSPLLFQIMGVWSYQNKWIGSLGGTEFLWGTALWKYPNPFILIGEVLSLLLGFFLLSILVHSSRQGLHETLSKTAVYPFSWLPILRIGMLFMFLGVGGFSWFAGKYSPANDFLLSMHSGNNDQIHVISRYHKNYRSTLSLRQVNPAGKSISEVSWTPPDKGWIRGLVNKNSEYLTFLFQDQSSEFDGPYWIYQMDYSGQVQKKLYLNTKVSPSVLYVDKLGNIWSGHYGDSLSLKNGIGKEKLLNKFKSPYPFVT